MVLGKVDGARSIELASARVTVEPRTTHRLRVVAIGNHLAVYVDGSPTAVIGADDSSYAGGTTGLIAHGTGASFDNVRIVDE